MAAETQPRVEPIAAGDVRADAMEVEVNRDDILEGTYPQRGDKDCRYDRTPTRPKSKIPGDQFGLSRFGY
jgi:hypothetical protein